MLLISPARAALALGTQCKTPTGVGDEALLEMLRLLTPRVEEALNVKSLARGVFTDYFAPPRDEYQYEQPFRLSNGFLLGSVAPVMAGVTEPGTFITDVEYGYIEVDGYTYDTKTEIAFTYTSGFDIPPAGPDVHADPEFRIAIGVPVWIEGVIVAMLTNYRRNNIAQPQVGKEYGFLPTLNEAITRDLRSRIYGRYMRQRDAMLWSKRCTQA